MHKTIGTKLPIHTTATWKSQTSDRSRIIAHNQVAAAWCAAMMYHLPCVGI
jgi:hypothetical protein